MASLYHLFPATIHPMVVHFTIAIIYLAFFAGLAAVIRKNDAFFLKAFIILLGLGIVATLAAGVAGVISESSVHLTPSTAAQLSVHKRDGELTGVFIVIAFAFQWIGQLKKKVSYVALLFSLISTVLVSITGHLGGTLVYLHGLGVHFNG